MKKIISLGGNYFQMTAVKAAKRLGYHVIDIDYLPQNIAHKYADEYINISTVDKEAVLKVAREKQVDGIISFASDVSAPTAAYVAEQLGLPTNPYDSVITMTRKDKFHPFLREHGFYVPKTTSITRIEDVYDFFQEVSGEIILKPINASGSKGISRIQEDSQIPAAFSEARKYARDDVLVAEEFVYRDGYQIAGDAFIVDGTIAVFGLANEHFDTECNPLVPIGESFPVSLNQNRIERARNEIQRAVTALKLKNGAINLDFMFTHTGEVFIIELGPRNGGNLITDAIQYANGIDLAEYTVKAAVGEDIRDLKDKPMDKYISSYIWHSTKGGIFEEMRLSSELKKKVLRSDLFVTTGEEIGSFENGGFGIGAAILQFDSESQMLDMMDHMNGYYDIILR